MIVPAVVLLPYGKFHDSPNNLLAGIETLQGIQVQAYRGSFPGFWVLSGLLFSLSGISPWGFIRLYPLGATLAYSVLAILLVRGVLRGAPGRSASKGLYSPIVVLVMLVIGPLIWMRNNLAPESLGYALAFPAFYSLIRRTGDLRFLAVFFLVFLAIVISHPLSPLLIIPGAIAILLDWGSHIPWYSRIPSAVAKTGGLILTSLAMYAGWLLHQSSWIVAHAVRLVNEALASEREITGLNRTIPGSEHIATLNLVFLGLFGTASVFMLARSRREHISRLALIWLILMLPFFAAAVGGRFLSRPLLFSMIPLSLGVAWGASQLTANGRGRAIIATSFIALFLIGSLGAMYVESYDRVTSSEIRSYVFAFSHGGDIYRPSMNLHFEEDGEFFETGSRLVGGSRAFLPERAKLHHLRIITVQSIVYSALEDRSDWPLSTDEFAAGLDGDLSILYTNGDAMVQYGLPRLR